MIDEGIPDMIDIDPFCDAMEAITAGICDTIRKMATLSPDQAAMVNIHANTVDALADALRTISLIGVPRGSGDGQVDPGYALQIMSDVMRGDED